MIPLEIDQKSEHIGNVKKVADFGITSATLPRILVSLSDKMYTKKELAVIREYSTNAVDAMTKAGKSITEIQVHLPTLEDLTFRIRDFGAGLSFDEIQNVYCVLGESDKRNSNDYNGMFGYGCKSGFAHADSFTVTSWNGGEKTIYQCIKGDTKKPHHVVELVRVPSDEPNGIQIEVPVKADSMWTFQTDARNFYKYWEILPTFTGIDSNWTENMETFRTTSATLRGDNWEIRPTNGSVPSGQVYMGYVSYRIDWDVLDKHMALDQKSRALFDIIKRNNVILHATIGEVSFVNSREELEYTKETIEFLRIKMKEIFDDIESSIQSKFAGLENIWEAKKVYNSIFGTGELALERGESHEDIENIKILQGNLHELERTFNCTFKWNDVVLNSPYFKDINRFDNCDGTKHDIKSYEPITPVLSTFRKKNTSVRRRKCSGHSHCDILASDSVAVVLNDTGKNTNMQALARFLVFKENSKIKVVHILSFDDDGLKNSFFEEFSFDDVPFLRASEIIDDVKSWVKASRGTIVRSGSGGGGVRTMKYFNLITGAIETTTMSARDIEDGSVFVRLGNARNTIINSNNYDLDINTACEHLFRLSKQVDLNFDQVYIINNQTGNSKWFKSEVDDGLWTSLWENIQDELTDNINWQELVTLSGFSDHSPISMKNIPNFVSDDTIEDNNSPFKKLLRMVPGVDYKKKESLISTLHALKLWESNVKDIPPIDWNVLGLEFVDCYPLMRRAFNRLQEGWSELDFNERASVAEYVNAMDAYRILRPEPKIEKELDKAA